MAASNKLKCQVLLILVLLIVSSTCCLWDNETNKKKTDNDNNIQLSEFEKKKKELNEKAVVWLGTLDVDPIELRNESGVKGKKKFVELLDAYLVLYEVAVNSQDKERYKDMV